MERGAHKYYTMREKAKKSLEKLQKMKPRRQYVPISNDIMTNWHKCRIDLPSINRTAVIDWANRRCIGQYSRDWDCYFFENEKDAFAFTLKWGSK
jgi:hypothetical protein